MAKGNVLDVESLQRVVTANTGGKPVAITYLAECGSTNSECMRIGHHRTVVIAEQQSAGRGRRGRTWHSPNAHNIYCSVGIEKSLPAEYLGLVSLQTGVCIADVLRDAGVDDVALKWPNDVLLHGSKLGGILTETRVRARNEFYLVIGFGLNTTMDTDTLAHIDRPAISLGAIRAQAIDRQALMAALISEILGAIDRLAVDHADELLSTFLHYDDLHGKAVRVSTRQETLTGVYRGLDRNGQIRVATNRGEQCFTAAEISLRESE